jgi:hypothetical protein
LDYITFLNSATTFHDSIRETILICQETAKDRQNHINAIENARNKKVFDNLSEYQTYVIEHQGKEQYDEFIYGIKQAVFENTNMTPRELEGPAKLSKYSQLEIELGKWEEIVVMQCPNDDKDITDKLLLKWLEQCSKARWLLCKMIGTIKHIRYEEWHNAKAHYIRIGKYGTIARMINPKLRSGPVAGNFYPTLPGEPIRRAINDHERKEASILTHIAWMDNPPW